MMVFDETGELNEKGQIEADTQRPLYLSGARYERTVTGYKIRHFNRTFTVPYDEVEILPHGRLKLSVLTYKK